MAQLSIVHLNYYENYLTIPYERVNILADKKNWRLYQFCLWEAAAPSDEEREREGRKRRRKRIVMLSAYKLSHD